MNPKIKKIDVEYDKNAAKIEKLQARQRELEKERMALENTDIVGLVRGMGLTPDQLAALIQGAMPAAPIVSPPQAEEPGKEDDAYEEG